MPAPASQQSQPPSQQHSRQHERRRQLRGLLLLAAIVLAFSLLRARHVFTPGWWRLW